MMRTKNQKATSGSNKDSSNEERSVKRSVCGKNVIFVIIVLSVAMLVVVCRDTKTLVVLKPSMNVPVDNPATPQTSNSVPALLENIKKSTSSASGGENSINVDKNDIATPDQTNCRPQPSDIRTCICYKTLFGNIFLDQVQHWVRYYKALGIDEFFMWHWGDLSTSDALSEFNRTTSQLVNLTLLPMPDKYVKRNADGSPQTDPAKVGQIEAERRCIQLARKRNITWAMFIDADEFLWFNQQVTLKEFLAAHEKNTYISFGKWMYSVQDIVEDAEDIGGYRLNQFAFTPREYCWMKPGQKMCPTWIGRCKVIVRPQLYNDVQVHGDPAGKIRSIHMNTDQAHFKEFVGIANHGHGKKVHERADFTTMEYATHLFRDAHPKHENGTITVYYDPDLEPWLRFVHSLDACNTSG